MKKFFKILPIAIVLAMLVVMLSACGGSSKVTQENADKITVGMTYDQVVKILGKEDDKEEYGTYEEGIIEYYWFNGAKNSTEAAIKLLQGKTIKSITVEFDEDMLVLDAYYEETSLENIY